MKNPCTKVATRVVQATGTQNGHDCPLSKKQVAASAPAGESKFGEAIPRSKFCNNRSWSIERIEPPASPQKKRVGNKSLTAVDCEESPAKKRTHTSVAYESKERKYAEKYAEAYEEWTSALSPERLAELERLGVEKFELPGRAKGILYSDNNGYSSSEDEDSCDSDIESLPISIGKTEPQSSIDETEPQITSSTEPFDDVIGKIIDHTRSSTKPELTLACFGLVLGGNSDGDSSQSSVAKHHGVSKTAVSKRCKKLAGDLDVGDFLKLSDCERKTKFQIFICRLISVLMGPKGGPKNLPLALDCFAFLTRIRCEDESMAEIARRHGIERATVSARIKVLSRKLGLERS